MDLNELLIQLDSISDHAQQSMHIPEEIKQKLLNLVDEISFLCLSNEIDQLKKEEIITTALTKDDSMIVDQKTNSNSTDKEYK